MRPPSRVRAWLARAIVDVDTPAARAADVQAEADVELDELLEAQLRRPNPRSPESPGRLAHQVAEVGCPPQRVDRQPELVPTDRTRALATCLGCGHLVRAHVPFDGCSAEGCDCGRSDVDALRDFGAELEASAELALRDFGGCSSRRIDGYCGEQGADVVVGLDTCPKGRP